MVCHALVAARLVLLPGLASLAWPLCAAAGEAGALRVCVGRQEQPPFVFNAQGKLRGVGLDVLGSVAARLKRSTSVQALPLARCIEAVRHGNVDLGLNLSSGVVKQPGLVGSQAYFQLHPELYALRQRNRPELPGTIRAADLSGLRLCGLRGVSYEDWGIASSAVDTGTNVYPELVRKLLLGRCEAVPEFRETVAGLYLINEQAAELATSARISRHTLHGRPLVGLHLVAADQPAGRALIEAINPVLADLQASGEIKHMLVRYLAP